MPSAAVRDAFVAKTMSAKRFYEDHQKEVHLVYRFTVALIIIPAVLAAVGAIVERAIYGTVNRPNFSPVLMLCGGFIAAPFILIRWLWPPKMKAHLGKLEFIYYVLFSAGFVVAVLKTTIAGNEMYYTGQHVRSVFGGEGSEEFAQIRSHDDVYSWLRKTFRRVYDKRFHANVFSRRLPGRIMLNGPVRLNQYRAVAKKCSGKVKSLGLVDSDQCYTSDEQDKSPYSSLHFRYYNTKYTNYVGKDIFASDISLKGTLNTYPLAGHWVMFNPDFSLETVEEMLAVLINNTWIDGQTRMISLDCTIAAPDFPQTTIASAIHMLEVTRSGLLVAAPPQVNFNYLDVTPIDLAGAASVAGVGDGSTESMVANNTASAVADDSGTAFDQCTVTKHSAYFMSVYLGILPGLVYTLYLHLVTVWDDWRKYLHNPFTYSELAWVITVMLSVGFRWRSVYFDHCDLGSIKQQLYQGDQPIDVYFFEFLQIAQEWYESRRILGLALFLHLFNLLRFIVQIPALSSLIRTLKIAFSELASFSLSFMVVFFAFVFMFYIIFSVESEDYQNIPRCIATLWLGMLGELSITPELWRVKDWTIPMIILFTFISVFVLLTVIIAIISDAHERSRIHREKAEDKRRQIAATVLLRWGKRPFARRRRNTKEKQYAGGGSHSSLAVFSSDKQTSKDTSFAGIVDMAVAARKASLKKANSQPIGPAVVPQGNGPSPPLPSQKATSECCAAKEERPISQVGLLSVMSDAEKGEVRRRDAGSKWIVRPGARFRNGGQTRRKHRESEEVLVNSVVDDERSISEGSLTAQPGQKRTLPNGVRKCTSDSTLKFKNSQIVPENGAPRARKSAVISSAQKRNPPSANAHQVVQRVDSKDGDILI